MTKPRGRRTLHPGKLVKEFVQDSDLSEELIAARLKLTPKELKALMAGKERVTRELAVRLGRTFGTSSFLWTNLQAAGDEYDFKRSPAGRREVLCQQMAEKLADQIGITLQHLMRMKWSDLNRLLAEKGLRLVFTPLKAQPKAH